MAVYSIRNCIGCGIEFQPYSRGAVRYWKGPAGSKLKTEALAKR